MQFNFQFPTRAVKHWGAWVGEGDLADLAVAAEECGFAVFSATDHPFPLETWVSQGGHHAFDPFVALAYAAARTSRIRLLTNLLVAGYRNPYLMAKSLASLDVLSGGRVIAGMGAGYMQEEFSALGGTFAGRGARFDAAIDAMRASWSGEPVCADGLFPAAGNVALPRPSGAAGPPIWIGGNGRPAKRRISSRADGWLPFEQSAAMAEVTGTPPLTPVQLPEEIAEIRRMRVDAGRPAEFDVCFTPLLGKDARANADHLAAQLDGYADAGVTHVCIESRARSFADCLTELETYSTLVAPVAAGPGR
ncbi:LLM class F420-dependent oxidoreductase [Pseudonocardia ailaonensis]|uniref:LLM class F420-dependent oxidoreductase n=1 Tax=Pseudonocardia ailaonensis TaxID=367279 RepID=A0ABN2MYS9_9PSEU